MAVRMLQIVSVLIMTIDPRSAISLHAWQQRLTIRNDRKQFANTLLNFIRLFSSSKGFSKKAPTWDIIVLNVLAIKNHHRKIFFEVA